MLIQQNSQKDREKTTEVKLRLYLSLLSIHPEDLTDQDVNLMTSLAGDDDVQLLLENSK